MAEGKSANEHFEKANELPFLIDYKPDPSDIDIDSIVAYHSLAINQKSIPFFFNGVFYNPVEFNPLIDAIQSTECTKLGIISQKEGFTTFKLSKNNSSELVNIPHSKSKNNE